MALGLLCGCGLGFIENHSGGASHLPTTGAGPYGKLPIDIGTPINEPIVLRVFRTNLREPTPLWREGGGVRLWFGYEDDPSVVRSEIWHVALPVITQFPEVPEQRALAGDEPWEQDWVGAPSIVRLPATGAGDGSGDGAHLVMFYQGGIDNPGIGRADSMDNGATWIKHPNNPILPGWIQPSVTFLDDTDETAGVPFSVYGTRLDRDGIYRADSSDGVTFSYLDEPVLEPRRGREGAYDRYSVSSPHVVVRAVEGGGYHYGMFFNATSSSDPDESMVVGWAGSFDGYDWQRFASPDGPVLAPGGASEYGPAVLLSADSGIMFYNEDAQGVQAIAAAMHP